MEDKLKYQLRSMAKNLYESEKSVRIWIKNTGGGENDLLFFIRRTQESDLTGRTKLKELADFESLYMAIIAKLKEIIGDIDIRKKNKFLSDDVILHNQGLDFKTPAEIRVGDFLASLHTKLDLLESKEVRELLRNAIKMRYIFRQRGLILLGHDPAKILAEDATVIEAKNKEVGKPVSNEEWEKAPDLMNHHKMNSAMIMGSLWERYRAELAEEKTSREERATALETKAHRERALNDLCGTPQVEVKETENQKTKPEVVKKAGLPCACDSECLCVPLCEAEPGQNCICKVHPTIQGLTRKPRGMKNEKILFGAASNQIAHAQIAGYKMPTSKGTRKMIAQVEWELEAMDETRLRRKERRLLQTSAKASHDGFILPTPPSSSHRTRHQPVVNGSEFAPGRYHNQTYPSFFLAAGAGTTLANATRVPWTHKLPQLHGTGRVSRDVMCNPVFPQSMCGPGSPQSRTSDDSEKSMKLKWGKKRSFKDIVKGKSRKLSKRN
ncbi:MAG: hypothetical protein M1827_000891 [Pycnora praestabilis]|nr:MAG: hypothetical protein M1827_000891 [Pycnora praestabilis]